MGLKHLRISTRHLNTIGTISHNQARLGWTFERCVPSGDGDGEYNVYFTREEPTIVKGKEPRRAEQPPLSSNPDHAVANHARVIEAFERVNMPASAQIAETSRRYTGSLHRDIDEVLSEIVGEPRTVVSKQVASAVQVVGAELYAHSRMLKEMRAELDARQDAWQGNLHEEFEKALDAAFAKAVAQFEAEQRRTAATAAADELHGEHAIGEVMTAGLSTRKVVGYIVLRGVFTLGHLQTYVLKFIETASDEGWEPLGAPFRTGNGVENNEEWAQAMVRYTLELADDEQQENQDTPPPTTPEDVQ